MCCCVLPADCPLYRARYVCVPSNPPPIRITGALPGVFSCMSVNPASHSLWSCHSLQSLGIYYTWRKTGQPGAFTRIVSCTDEQSSWYAKVSACSTLHFCMLCSQAGTSAVRYRDPAPATACTMGCSGHRCVASCKMGQALNQLTLLFCWLQLLLSIRILPQPLTSAVGNWHFASAAATDAADLRLQFEALLLACLQEMQIVPSIRVKSLTEDPEHNDVYSAYNKPGAVLFWLRVSHQVPLACLGSLSLPAAAVLVLCQ